MTGDNSYAWLEKDRLFSVFKVLSLWIWITVTFVMSCVALLESRQIIWREHTRLWLWNTVILSVFLSLTWPPLRDKVLERQRVMNVSVGCRRGWWALNWPRPQKHMMKMHYLSDVCESNWRALQVTVKTLLKGNDEKCTTPYAEPTLQPFGLMLFSAQEDENIQHESCSYHGSLKPPHSDSDPLQYAAEWSISSLI